MDMEIEVKFGCLNNFLFVILLVILVSDLTNPAGSKPPVGFAYKTLL